MCGGGVCGTGMCRSRKASEEADVFVHMGIRGGLVTWPRMRISKW